MEEQTIQEAVFTCEMSQTGEVHIHWDGSHMVTLTGEAALRLIHRLETLEEADAVHLMARATHRFPLTLSPEASKPKD